MFSNKYNKILSEMYIKNIEGMKLGLDRIEEALTILGNPHKIIKTIHVAGTNGKGSTSNMISSILIDAGYNVGLFTSPFLSDFRESITINKKLIGKKNVVKLYQKVIKTGIELTYFEIKTIMAFLYFYEKEVDYAVIEVGLGGRLDATNVINPLISVITNIGKDHENKLGDSVEEIAMEKAGIIKEETPIVTKVDNGGLKIIEEIAKEKKAPIFIINGTENLNTNLCGNFQKKNATLAKHSIIILREMYPIKVSDGNITNGLMNIKLNGRFDLRNQVLYDCAHNPDAIKILSQEISNLKYDKIVTVISILKDKNIKEMTKIVKEFSDEIIVTSIKDNNRASNGEDLFKIISKGNEKVIYKESSKKALKIAKTNAGKKGLVVVTGSGYLVGELIK